MNNGVSLMQAQQNLLVNGRKQLTGARDALEGPGAGAGAASSLRPLAADTALAGARYALEGPGAGAGAACSRWRPAVAERAAACSSTAIVSKQGRQLHQLLYKLH